MVIVEAVRLSPFFFAFVTAMTKGVAVERGGFVNLFRDKGCEWVVQHKISPEEILNSSVKNGNSPPRDEMKLRKNEMKLRKNRIVSPKNFPIPHWISKDLHRGISDFFHRDVDEFIVI